MVFVSVLISSTLAIFCALPSSRRVKSVFFRSRTRFPFLSCATTLTRTSSLVTWMRDSDCPVCWAATGAAVCSSSPAALKIENAFLGNCIYIFFQKRNRAVIVTRRMLPVPVTSP